MKYRLLVAAVLCCQGIFAQGSAKAVPSPPEIFIKADISTTSCYIGEPVVVSYTIFSPLPVETYEQRSPAFYGFSVQDLINYNEPHPGIALWKGKLFATSLLRKLLLYPVQTGRLLIDPMYASVPAPGAVDRKTQIELHSPSVEIDVKPLPPGKPPGFHGAVGKFSMHTELPAQAMRLNETGKLVVVLEGAGNFIQFAPPAIQWPEGLEGMEAQLSENLVKSDSGVAGMRRYEFPFTASRDGRFIIPPVRFSFFDPAEEKYHVISGEALETAIMPAPPLEEKISKAAKENPSAVLVTLLLLALGISIIALINFYRRKKSPVQQKTDDSSSSLTWLNRAKNPGLTEREKAACLIKSLDLFLSKSPDLLAGKKTHGEKLRNELQLMLYAGEMNGARLERIREESSVLLTRKDHSAYL